MKNQKMACDQLPTAHISVRKSRLKIYNKEKPVPTYYLEKDSEFEIELYNLTSETVLAKIKLNGREISQGGLVLRPAEHIFLDRFLDVQKKFKFDVYEVANTNEARAAIEDNGDIEVAFYKEKEVEQQPYNHPYTPIIINTQPFVYPYVYPYTQPYNPPYNPSPFWYATCDCNTTVGTTQDRPSSFTYSNENTAYNANVSNCNCSCNDYSGRVTLDECKDDSIFTPEYLGKRSKSIETGMVEPGGRSEQTFKSVDKSFEWASFCIVRYKLLPVSQRALTSEDINVRRYCTNCSAVLKPTFKFCAHCGKAV